jgi:hypothetical protein
MSFFFITVGVVTPCGMAVLSHLKLAAHSFVQTSTAGSRRLGPRAPSGAHGIPEARVGRLESKTTDLFLCGEEVNPTVQVTGTVMSQVNTWSTSQRKEPHVRTRHLLPHLPWSRERRC